MKNLTTKVNALAIKAAFKGNEIKQKSIGIFTQKSGENFVDTAIKILMAVVIGALVLAGLYALFGDTVLPTLTKRVEEMFDYKG